MTLEAWGIRVPHWASQPGAPVQGRGVPLTFGFENAYRFIPVEKATEDYGILRGFFLNGSHTDSLTPSWNTEAAVLEATGSFEVTWDRLTLEWLLDGQRLVGMLSGGENTGWCHCFFVSFIVLFFNLAGHKICHSPLIWITTFVPPWFPNLPHQPAWNGWSLSQMDPDLPLMALA